MCSLQKAICLQSSQVLPASTRELEKKGSVLTGRARLHTSQQMASFISDTIFAALKTQFEDAMRKVVISIAEGEGLDVQELMDKYLVNVIPASKEAKGKAPAKKSTKKATVTVSEAVTASCTSTCCSCTTAKGKPCSLKPLSGTTMCRIHTKKAEAGGASTGVSTGPIKPAPAAKAKKPKKVKRDEPVHTHELDDMPHNDCELCQTHGNPLNDHQVDEYETVMSPVRTLRQRLTHAEEFVEEEE